MGWLWKLGVLRENQPISASELMNKPQSAKMGFKNTFKIQVDKIALLHAKYIIKKRPRDLDLVITTWIKHHG